MADGEDQEAKSGEILPDGAPDVPADGANWLALISNYTERPDLFLAEIEKHDPGFIKRMNKSSEERADKDYNARFNFGRFQAYSSLGVAIGAAIVILAVLAFAVYKGMGSFWLIIGLAVFYAVSQGGTQGFLHIAKSISELFKKAPPTDPK